MSKINPAISILSFLIIITLSFAKTTGPIEPDENFIVNHVDKYSMTQKWNDYMIDSEHNDHIKNKLNFIENSDRSEQPKCNINNNNDTFWYPLDWR